MRFWKNTIVFYGCLYWIFQMNYPPPSCPNLKKMASIREEHLLQKITLIQQTRYFMKSACQLKTPIW